MDRLAKLNQQQSIKSDHVKMLLSKMDDFESLSATNSCPESIGTASRQPPQPSNLAVTRGT